MSLPATVTAKCWAYCLPFNFFSLHSRHVTMGVTVLGSSLCLPPPRQMPGWLLALAAGPIRPTLDTSAALLACFHHSCSAQCCSLGPFTGAQPVYDCRFAALILSSHVLQGFPDDFLEGLCCPLCHGETSCAFIPLDGVCSIVTEWIPYPTLLRTWEIRIPVFFQRLTHNQSPFYPGAMLPTASTRQLIIGASVFCI